MSKQKYYKVLEIVWVKPFDFIQEYRGKTYKTEKSAIAFINRNAKQWETRLKSVKNAFGIGIELECWKGKNDFAELIDSYTAWHMDLEEQQ